MTQSEIRDRLLDLARVRLKARFGAFEQFRFTLDGLPAGAAILTRATLMPAPWLTGLRLGIDEAARQIDAHLLRLIDEWAQQEAPARQIPVLEGLQPLAAEPQAEAQAPSAAPEVKEAPHERRARWLDMFEAEKKREKRGALQRVADREGVDRSNMSKGIYKARAERGTERRAGGWASQLVQDGKRKR